MNVNSIQYLIAKFESIVLSNRVFYLLWVYISISFSCSCFWFGSRAQVRGKWRTLVSYSKKNFHYLYLWQSLLEPWRRCNVCCLWTVVYVIFYLSERHPCRRPESHHLRVKMLQNRAPNHLYPQNQKQVCPLIQRGHLRAR